MIVVGKIEINGTSIPDNNWIAPHFLPHLAGHSWDSFPNFISWMETMTHLERHTNISLRAIKPIPDIDPQQSGLPAIEFWLEYLEKETVPPHSVVSLLIGAEDDQNYPECDRIIKLYS